MLANSCKKDDGPTGNNSNQTIEESFNTNCGIIPPIIACIKGANVFIPNAFSPNGDGFNDVFFLHVGDGMKEMNSFKIYNQSGNLIFQESNILLHSVAGDPGRGWDGKHPDGSVQDGIILIRFQFLILWVKYRSLKEPFAAGLPFQLSVLKMKTT